MRRQWALLPDGTYGTHRTYVLDPISAMSPIGPIDSAAPPVA